MPGIFVSYVRDDQLLVDRLVRDLAAHGAQVWLDRSAIKPGQRWEDAIRRGISEGDFFLACFSKAYSGRKKTFMNEELTLAIEELRQRSFDPGWFIPLRLDDCEIPPRPVGAGETFHSFQRVDLFADWEEGVRRILSVVRPQEGPIQIDRRDFAVLNHSSMSSLLGIRHIVETLGREDLPATKRKELANLAKSTIDIAMLQSRDFVALGLSLQANPQIFPTEVDLASEVQVAARRLTALARQKKLQFSFSGLESIPKRMLLDDRLIGLMLHNVIQNAVKYSIMGADRENSIRIRASKPTPEVVRLEVINKGARLSELDQQRVFERGYRGVSSAANQPVGTGLGLFVSREVASSHSGSISIKSLPGELIVVTIDLPIRER